MHGVNSVQVGVGPLESPAQHIMQYESQLTQEGELTSRFVRRVWYHDSRCGSAASDPVVGGVRAVVGGMVQGGGGVGGSDTR